MHNLFVAHFLQPPAEGSQVQMGRWPTHLTLAANFFTQHPLDEVLAELQTIAKSHPITPAHLVQEALFGERGEYRVLLAEPTTLLLGIHFDIVEVVAQVGHFDQPEYSSFGYRPHITLQPATRLQVGDTVMIDSMTVFDYDKSNNSRTALRTFQLG